VGRRGARRGARPTPRMLESLRSATLLKRLGTPQDVAKAVLYLIENADYVTGAAIPVDGGRLVA
jgi:pteridine reductase